MSDITNRIGLAQQPQRQDSLANQMRDVMRLAAFFGCYDAHDWLLRHWDATDAEASP